MDNSTSGSVDLRLARAADIPGISELGTRVFTATFGHSVKPHELEAFLHGAYSHEATSSVLADGNRDLVVAVPTGEEHTILGFALLTRNTSEPCIAHLSDAVELQRLYVDTAVHGKGVGGRLVRYVEARAREQGFRFVWLSCWEENGKSLKVYERLGFKVLGERDFDVGGVIQRDLILLKPLQ